MSWKQNIFFVFGDGNNEFILWDGDLGVGIMDFDCFCFLLCLLSCGVTSNVFEQQLFRLRGWHYWVCASSTCFGFGMCNNEVRVWVERRCKVVTSHLY